MEQTIRNRHTADAEYFEVGRAAALVRRRYGPPPIPVSVSHTCGGLLVPVPGGPARVFVVDRQAASADFLFDGEKQLARSGKSVFRNGGVQDGPAQGQEVVCRHQRPCLEAVDDPVRPGGDRAAAHAASLASRERESEAMAGPAVISAVLCCRR